MFTVRVLLQDLTVHPELLYDGNQRLSKFTYVQRLLTLNKSAVLMLHNLEQFVLGVVPSVPSRLFLQLPGHAHLATSRNLLVLLIRCESGAPRHVW